MADLRKPEGRPGVKEPVDDVHPNGVELGPIAASPPDDAARVAEVARLYERHKAEVFRLALRYGAGRRDFAEDVLQDVFFRLFEALGRLEARTDLSRWLYRVTANVSISRIRREKVAAAASLSWLFGRSDRVHDTPESLASAHRELVLAEEILAELPAKERIAFCMHHLDGKELLEIGALIGHSKGYVSKLVARAETRVRKRRQKWR